MIIETHKTLGSQVDSEHVIIQFLGGIVNILKVKYLMMLRWEKNSLQIVMLFPGKGDKSGKKDRKTNAL